MQNLPPETRETAPSGSWSDLWKQEDNWAVLVGLIIVLLAIILWKINSTFLNNIAFYIPRYSDFGTAVSYLKNQTVALITLYLFFAILFTIAIKPLGYNVSSFIAGFTVLFILSVIITVGASWSLMKHYNIETPLLALTVGLFIGNIVRIPTVIDTALCTNFFLKTGIVLMGATLPFSLIVMAGTTAFAQASIVTVATFLSIYWAGTRVFKLDKRFAATLAAGGSICGVSAAIAVGGSIKADKHYVSIAISLIIIWSIILIFALPVAINMLKVPPGPAGAWIGTLELADAPGMAIAASIDEQAIKTFTLMKVIGRDMFIGIWCFIMALISITRWDKTYDGSKPDVAEIWIRFPKFILGFFIASIILTILITVADTDSFKVITNNVINPIRDLRDWAFIFAFLSIGLTSRFKELASIGFKPFIALGIGILVNIPLGYLLSVIIMGSYWVIIK